MSKLSSLRERLHMCPEPGMKEYETKKELMKFITTLSQERITVIPVLNTGLIIIYRNSENPFVLVRADMDGLPLQEETGADYASKIPGWMHACGHDIHMTVLAGVLERVVEQNPKINTIFLFQPAEEGPGGAEPILRSGTLDNYDIGSALALHVNPDYPVGTIASRTGAVFSSGNEFDVVFEGKESHGAFPHRGRDAILPAAGFVKASYEMLSRFIPEENRFMFTIGRFSAGNRRNIVAGKAIIEGTFRTLDNHTKRSIMHTIERLASNLAEAWNTRARVEYGAMYPVVFNDSSLVESLRDTVRELAFSFVECGPTFTGEDFGFIAQRYPSVLFWLGCSGSSRNQELHTPSFLPEPSCVEVGVDIIYGMLTRLFGGAHDEVRCG